MTAEADWLRLYLVSSQTWPISPPPISCMIVVVSYAAKLTSVSPQKSKSLESKSQSVWTVRYLAIAGRLSQLAASNSFLSLFNFLLPSSTLRLFWIVIVVSALLFFCPIQLNIAANEGNVPRVKCGREGRKAVGRSVGLQRLTRLKENPTTFKKKKCLVKIRRDFLLERIINKRPDSDHLARPSIVC